MKLAPCLAAVVLVTSVLSSPSAAAKLKTGSSVIWVGLHGNRSELVSPILGSGPAFEDQEIGLLFAYSYFLNDKWSVNGSGGFDLGNQTVKLNVIPTIKQTSSSWSARLGFDRYAFINDDVAIYAGPGFLYWRGHAEGDGTGDEFFDQEWPTVRQLAFNGRLGMYARFAQHYGLYGHIGQVIGSVSSEAGGGKITWWTSHHEGSVGVAMDF